MFVDGFRAIFTRRESCGPDRPAGLGRGSCALLALTIGVAFVAQGCSLIEPSPDTKQQALNALNDAIERLT
jgi:hypothetical protein